MADAARKPYMAPQILSNAYTIVYNTGLFNQDCRDWRRKPLDEKTWANFKTHFLTADMDFRQQQAVQGNRYGTANLAFEQTTDALANLAQATATDR